MPIFMTEFLGNLVGPGMCKCVVTRSGDIRGILCSQLSVSHQRNKPRCWISICACCGGVNRQVAVRREHDLAKFGTNVCTCCELRLCWATKQDVSASITLCHGGPPLDIALTWWCCAVPLAQHTGLLHDQTADGSCCSVTSPAWHTPTRVWWNWRGYVIHFLGISEVSLFS